MKKIRHIEKVAETKLLFIEFREEQVSGELSALQEEITQLKARISEIVSKKIPIDNENMAQTNPDSIAIILTNRTAMSNSLQAIRRHIDGSRVLNPVNPGQNFDNTITDGLETILRNGAKGIAVILILLYQTRIRHRFAPPHACSLLLPKQYYAIVRQFVYHILRTCSTSLRKL